MAQQARGVGPTWIIGQTEDIHQHYRLGRTLGQAGQFGRAVEAEKVGGGGNQKYAVKIISKLRFSKNARDAIENFAAFRAEIEVMKKMEHPNIIKMHEVFEDLENLYIVMECCAGGELFDRITARGHYTERDAALVLRQIFAGVYYMHTHKIAHCDLKPDNFLFSSPAEDSLIKIIDFGMSKFLKPRQYFDKFCGTPYYVAPEVIAGKYTESCDMWSLGVVTFVVLHGYPPFYADPAKYQGNEDSKVLQLIRRGFDPSVREGYGAHFPKAIPISAAAMDLITKLLTQDTKKRLSAQEALDHPWLTGEAASQQPIALSVVRSLRTFVKTTHFKAAVLDLMQDTLTDSDIAQLKQTFSAMDENKDGSITMAELTKGLQSVDSTVLKEEIETIMKAADVDQDGAISYKELMMTFVQRRLNAKEERLWDSFCRLDLNGDGRISLDELKQVLKNERDEQRLKDLISDVDKDKNGTVDYEEFLSLWFPPPAEDPALLNSPSNQQQPNDDYGYPFQAASKPKAQPAPQVNQPTAPVDQVSNSSCCVLL